MSRSRHDAVAWALAALIVASTFVPYLAQRASPPPGHTFSFLLTSIPDQCSYLMWMDQHRHGAFLVQDRMTTEPGAGGFLPNPVWLVLGWLAALTGLPLIIAYHAGRAALALGYLLVLWALCKEWLPQPRVALLAFALAATGSGLAWVQPLGIDLPTADWITELWSYPSLLYYPHFAAALLLACAGLLLLARARRATDGRRRARRAAVAGILLALLVLVHPYTAVALFLAIAVQWAICRWRGLAGAGRDELLALAWMAASFAVIAAHLLLSPGMRAWARQNEMPSPAPHHYLLGLGLVFALAVAGTVRLMRAREWEGRTVLWLSWIGVAALLAYGSPVVPYERRCIEGVHLAFALLGATALAPWLSRSSRLTAASAIAGLVLAVVPTNALLVAREAVERNPGQVHSDWHELYEAVRALPGERTIFADTRTGMFLAGFAGATVYAAHDQLTPDLAGKRRTLEVFFTRPLAWSERLSMIRGAGCRWLVLDPRYAVALGRGGPPATLLRSSGRTWAIWGPM